MGSYRLLSRSLQDGLAQMPNPPEPSSSSSPFSSSSAYSTPSPSSGSASTHFPIDRATLLAGHQETAANPTIAATSSTRLLRDDESSSSGTSSSGTSSSTFDGGASISSGTSVPLFLLHGVTTTIRAADGTLLQLRPAFLSMNQLKTMMVQLRDAWAADWLRKRSERRWQLVSAMDMLTVHSAGPWGCRCEVEGSGAKAATRGLVAKAVLKFDILEKINFDVSKPLIELDALGTCWVRVG